MRALLVFRALGTWILAVLVSGCNGGPTALGDGEITRVTLRLRPN